MAGFSLVNEPMLTKWFPVDYNAVTLYVGQLVTWCFADSGQGLKAWNVAGVADTTADQSPLGVVIGFNNKTPVFNTTYKAEYGLSVSTQAAQLAREWAMAEGMWSKGEPALLAQVAILDPMSVLKGRIFHASYGTALDVLTNTTASTDGSTITTVAVDYAPVAYNTTFYCRTGANMGLYRTSYSTSTTSHTFYLTWPYDIAVNDTFVEVHLALGTSKALFDSVGTFVQGYGEDNATVYSVNCLWLDIFELNLAEAGNEYAIFRINPYQFLPERP